MKLVIQIPCLNEEESLPVALKALPKTIEGIDEIEVLVIDDGSIDNTMNIAQKAGVEVLTLGSNKGLAKAFIAGLNKSLAMGADIIVNTDADNQYKAEYIKNLIKPILENKADIVIGARPVDSIKHFSPLKKFLQKLGSAVMRFVSSSSVKDAPSGFRAFSKNAALQMNVFDKYTYTLETIMQARAKGLIIESVEVDVNPGLRKSRLFKNMFQYIRRSIFTMLRMFIIYRPFRFFIVFGFLFLIAGLIPGLRYLYFYLTGNGAGHIQSLILSAILLIFGIQITLIAVLSELLSINRKLLEDIQYRVKLESLKNNSEGIK